MTERPKRPDWWLNVELPPSEHVVSVGVWSPDDAVIVTNEAVYRATWMAGRVDGISVLRLIEKRHTTPALAW